MPLTAIDLRQGPRTGMRLTRDGDHHTPRELSLTVLMKGAFDAAWTAGDNRACVATDSVKNIVNVTAAKNLSLDKEAFAEAVAEVFLGPYPQIEEIRSRARRRAGCGTPSAASRTATPSPSTATAPATSGSWRAAAARVLQSGLRDFTFMKTTQSGWADFVDDDYRTLPDTTDRIAATAMDATWTWTRAPADYAATNAEVLDRC